MNQLSRPHPDPSVAHVRALYLGLMQRALLHTLYRPIDTAPLPAHVIEAFSEAIKEAVASGITLASQPAPDPVHLRETGRDNPLYAQTMVGVARLDHLRNCIETVLADRIDGDLIEAGVWRGGVGIFMRAILQAYEITDRSVVLADSFEGLPPSDASKYPEDGAFVAEETGRFAVDETTVRANFANYGLLDEQVEFVPGWFRDSLPALSSRTWAVIRLDGDLYESTWDSLAHLYPQLSPGGYLIIDDWVLPPCRAAVEDYRRTHGITDKIIDIDWASACWRRSRR